MEKAAKTAKIPKLNKQTAESNTHSTQQKSNPNRWNFSYSYSKDNTIGIKKKIPREISTIGIDEKKNDSRLYSQKQHRKDRW